jgi:hypothetical protein
LPGRVVPYHDDRADYEDGDMIGKTLAATPDGVDVGFMTPGERFREEYQDNLVRCKARCASRSTVWRARPADVIRCRACISAVFARLF